MRSRAVPVASLAVLALVLVASALPGCGPKPAATVNGVTIAQAQVDSEIAAMKKEHPEIFKGANGQKMEEQFRKRIVDNLVTNVLVLQEAKAKGISVSDAEVEAKIKSMAHAYPSQAAFEAAMTKTGTSMAALRERLKTQALSQKLVSSVTAKVKVTDAEAKQYYLVNKEMFGGQPTLHVVAIKFGPTPADFKTAKKVAAQLKNVGPYMTAGASWIIKVMDRKAPAQQPYAAVKAQIVKILTEEKQVKAFNDWLQSLKKKANISQ